MLKTEAPEDEDEDIEEEELEPAEPPTTQLQAVVPPAIEAVLAPPRIRKMGFVRRRNGYFLFSLLIIIPGIYFMVHSGFALGIDFAGGTELTVRFLNHPTGAQVESAVAAENIGGTVIPAGPDTYIIRTRPMSTVQQTQEIKDLTARVGPIDAGALNVLEVGGTISGETSRSALLSVVVLVLVAILVAGGDSLKGFALALLIGIVSGTYSSIFNAAPLLVVWRRLQPLR